VIASRGISIVFISIGAVADLVVYCHKTQKVSDTLASNYDLSTFIQIAPVYKVQLTSFLKLCNLYLIEREG
jgi:hypothetical protein